MTVPKQKILILACIWDNLGDIVFATKIRDIFQRWEPKIIYYYKDPKDQTAAHIEFLKQNVHNYQLCRTAAEVVQKYRAAVLGADVILNTTPKYNQMTSKIISIGYSGKYFRIFDYSLGQNETYENDTDIRKLCSKKITFNLDNTHNIYTGFGNGSSGMLVTDEIPRRTMSIWDKSRYPYDNIFTCYLHNAEFGRAFIEFIRQNFGSARNLLVVQGKSWSNAFTGRKVVREGSLGRVYEYYPNLHIVNDMFPLHESNELFYYSHPITAATGNWSMSTCISYGKTLFLDWRPDLTKTQCLFWEFLDKKGFGELKPIFRYLIDTVAVGKTEIASANNTNERSAPIANIVDYIAEKRDKMEQLHKFIQEDFNLQKNLYAQISRDLSAAPASSNTGVSTSAAKLGAAVDTTIRVIPTRAIIALILVIVVLIIMYIFFMARRANHSIFPWQKTNAW